MIAEELPGAAISLSHEIGRIGLLERENATIMNACLRELASQIVAAFHAALAELGIEAPVYLSQNDGTLMTRRLRRALPGGDLRVRADELDARRRVPLRPRRLRRGRHRRHDLGRRHPPARLPARGVGRGRDRRRAHELPDAGRALARDRRRLARRRRRGRAAERRLRADVARARLRRRRPDRDRPRGRGRARRDRRPRSASPGSTRRRRSRGSRSGSPRRSTG